MSAIGALVAGVIGLAGCAGGSLGGYGGRAPLAAGGPRSGAIGSVSSRVARGVPAAAARTLALRARVGFRLDGARVFGPTRAPVFGSGVFDFASGRGREVIDLPEVRHREPGTEHVIFLPARVFLQPRASGSRVLPRGKSWVLANLTGSDVVATNFPSFVGQVEGVNPMLVLQELAWGATSAVPIAERPALPGVRAQGYEVSVDLPRALAAAGRAAASVSSLAIQQQLSALASSESRSAASVPVFAWVDGSGRVVQWRVLLPGAGVGTALVALSLFGIDARLDVPSAGQVVDIGSLTPSGERESNGGGDSDGA